MVIIVHFNPSYFHNIFYIIIVFFEINTDYIVVATVVLW